MSLWQYRQVSKELRRQGVGGRGQVTLARVHMAPRENGQLRPLPQPPCPTPGSQHKGQTHSRFHLPGRGR